MQRKVIILGIAFLLYLVNVEAQFSPKKYLTEKIIDSLRVKDASLPNMVSGYLLGGGTRVTLHDTQVPAKFCAYDPQTGCHNEDYLESIIALVIPGVAVGVVLFLILVCFGIIKRCCCSGGEFDTGDVICLKVLIIITILLISGALIAAFVGNSKAHNGGNGFIQQTINFAQSIQNISINVTTTLKTIPEFSSIDFTTTLQATQSLIDTSQQVQTEFEKYENIRSNVFIAAYVILIVMCFLALVSCFIWICISGQINFCLGLILILFMWLVFALTLALGNANTDICEVFDDELYAYQHGQKNSDILSTFLGQWGANCSAFAEVEEQSIAAFNNYTLQFCEQYNSLCSSSGFTGGCQACTQDTNFNTLVATSRVYNYADCPNTACSQPCTTGTCKAGNVSLIDCQTQCMTSQERNAAVQAVTLAADHEIVKGLIALIQPYLGCSLIALYIETVYDPVCNQFLYGMELLVVASSLIGIFLIAFNVEMLYSIDRFDPNNALNLEQHDAWREDQESGKPRPEAIVPKSNWSTLSGTIGFVPSSAFVVQRSTSESNPGPASKKLSMSFSSSISRGYSFSSNNQPKDRNPIPDFNSTEMANKNQANDNGYG